MKVLFVCPDHYPLTGACTNILNNILNTGILQQECKEISVMCVSNDGGVDEKCFNGIKVHYITIPELTSIQNYQSKNRNQMYNKAKLIARKALSKFFLNIYGRVGYNFLIAHQVFNYLAKIKAKEFDFIIPICGDYNIAAGVLKFVNSNKNIRLLVYQVDPYSTRSTLSAKYLQRRKKLEIKLIDASQHYITTDILKREYEQWLPQYANDKIVAMEFPNLVDRTQVMKKESRSNQYIHCYFAGSIYGVRNPEYTFKMFKELYKYGIILHLIGVEKKNIPECYMKYIICHGKLSIEETHGLLSSSDYLVNIGNNNTNQIPSKIIEYISYGKPIINFYKTMRCPTLPLLSEYTLAINVYEGSDDFDNDFREVLNFIKTNISNSVSYLEIEKVFYKATPTYFCNALLSFLLEE